MKKVIFLLLVIFLLSACSHSREFQVGQSVYNINDHYTAYININTLSVYKIDDNCLITINNGNFIQKLVEYSSDRKCRRVQGLDLIKSYDIEHFLNINFEDLAERIGQPHLDIGSGFYIPAYLTVNADLISFRLENGIIIEVIKRDLFANKIVDYVIC